MQRLLVIRWGAVGDLIVTLPALKLLREAFPHATLDILGHSSRAILAQHPRYAHRIVDVEHGDVYRLFSPNTHLSEALASYLRSFALIVSYLPTSAKAFISNVRRYSIGEIISWSPHPPAHVHITDHLMQPLAALGQPPYDAVPQVYVTPAAQVTAERFWQRERLPQCGVIAWHLGSGGAYKLWPPAGWRRIMTWAATQGYPGLIINGPAEQDREPNPARTRLWPAWPRVQHYSLPEVAAILARCRLLIGHDSGISHLAAAVGTPTLALFGPTCPHVWGPRSGKAWVIQPHPAGPLTLENLPPAVVIKVLEQLLHGTLPCLPSQVDCTILAVTPAGAIVPTLDTNLK